VRKRLLCSGLRRLVGKTHARCHDIFKRANLHGDEAALHCSGAATQYSPLQGTAQP